MNQVLILFTILDNFSSIDYIEENLNQRLVKDFSCSFKRTIDLKTGFSLHSLLNKQVFRHLFKNILFKLQCADTIGLCLELDIAHLKNRIVHNLILMWLLYVLDHLLVWNNVLSLAVDKDRIVGKEESSKALIV